MDQKLLSNLIQPNNIDEVAGQTHLVGKGSPIRRMVENKQLFSMIFFGLPGIGKTSLSKAICKNLNLKYETFNPTINNKSYLEKIIQKLDEDQSSNFVLIIDEIHRMNKDKQDILLSYLEKGKLIILGTTTENPYFVVNPSIRSRCFIFELKPIEENEMISFLEKIVSKNEIKISSNNLKIIVKNSLGDLRRAINLVDIVSKLAKNSDLSETDLKKILPSTNIMGSSYGNEFYNLQSAFHKSLRGSDINASLYYLARLIKIGDIQSISRRMIAMAYEDIGLANPNLISRVILAINSAERLGFPEAKQILATTVIEMCLSPKSNSAYLAIEKALEDIEKNGTGTFDIPNHLKDKSYKSSYKLGYKGYKYPHDYKNNWVRQDYLPKQLKGKIYYKMGNNEIEIKMNKIFEERTKDEE